MTILSLIRLSNQGITKTDKYSAKNTIWNYRFSDKVELLFNLITKVLVGPDQSIPSHPQARVRRPGGRKEGSSGALRLQALPSALPSRTSFLTFWFSLVFILQPMAMSLISISIHVL